MCSLDIEILIKFKFNVVFNNVLILLKKLNEFMILMKTNLNLMLK